MAATKGRVEDPRSVSSPPSGVVPRDSGTVELEADTNGVRHPAAHGPWRRSGTRHRGPAPYSPATTPPVPVLSRDPTARTDSYRILQETTPQTSRPAGDDQRMTIKPQPRSRTHLTWITATRSREHDTATTEPPARSPRWVWLAHPYWAGLSTIIATVLALASLWLALIT